VTHLQQYANFFNPFLDVDYSPLIGEVRHRVTGTVIYDIPWLADRKDVVGGVWAGGSFPACSTSERANRCASPRRRALQQPAGL